MKWVRGFLVFLAAAVVLLLGLAAAGLNSRLQTWAAHHILARRPALAASVGTVAIGWGGVELRNVRIERRGGVLTLPDLAAELPLFPVGFHHRVSLRSLTAKGWTLDLTGLDTRSLGLTPSAVAEDAAIAPLENFQGILQQLQLPVDFALDQVELEGDVILPDAPGYAGGRAHVVISGGGLAPSAEGHFAFSLKFTPAVADGLVNSVLVEGALTATMDGPRTFRRFVIRAGATATGAKLAGAVRLSASAGVSRAAVGETYFLTLDGDHKRLASLRAAVADDKSRPGGEWHVDICDADLAPFLLGRALPTFDLAGGGHFDGDAAWSEVHATGKLNLTIDRLALVCPELAGIGAVGMAADFDLTRRGPVLRIDRLKAALRGPGPILTLEGLQAFGFNSETDELTVADSTRDLFGLTLEGVPLGWAQPFLHGLVLVGDPLRGRLVASARDNGISFRSIQPLRIASLSATRRGQPLLQNLDLSFTPTANATPLGWQVEVKGQVENGGAPRRAVLHPAPLLAFDAKFGRLTDDQDVKVAGRWHVDLPAAITQPALSRELAASAQTLPTLAAGGLTCDFTASLAVKSAIEAKLETSDLTLAGGEKLPALSADIRVDLDPGRQIVFTAPLFLQQGERRSDLTFSGLGQAAAGGFAFTSQVTGSQLFLEDLKPLAGVVAVSSAFAKASAFVPVSGTTADGTAAPAPFWRGLSGQLTLALQNVTAPRWAVTGVAGTLRFEPAKLVFDGWRASLEGNGDVTMSGVLACGGDVRAPYAFSADLAVGNFDPVPLLRARYPGRRPTIEGKFNITGRVSGHGRDPSGAVSQLDGEFQFASKGGVLRVLSTKAPPKDGAAGKGAGLGSFFDEVAGVVTGRKDTGPKISDLVGRISTIPYDQMSFVLSRGASRDTVMRDFAAISPEMRLEGGGRVSYRAGQPLVEQPLAAEFKLKVRGPTADLLKSVGLLDSHPDDLGYSAFIVPLKIGGTLGQPDTSELRAALIQQAYEHSGASDLLDKLLGK